jgi:hypothetical protein
LAPTDKPVFTETTRFSIVEEVACFLFFVVLGFTLCFALVVLSLCVGALAQGTTGELSGLVTDPTHAVVAGATVKLTNPATKEIRTTTTTAAGIYIFLALAVGSYSLELSPKGFKSQDIVVSVGGATTRDVKLEVGAQGEQVMVEAGAKTVQTTESERIADGSLLTVSGRGYGG